jgi:hypothetical protein
MTQTIQATYGGNPLNVNVTLEYKVTDGRLTFKLFETDHLILEPLKTDGDTVEALRKLFNPGTNQENIAKYGDGTHGSAARVEAKVKLWGGRGDNGEPYECLVAWPKTDGEAAAAHPAPVGFFNLGKSGINGTDGKMVHELGIFCHVKYGETSLPVELVTAGLYYCDTITNAHRDNGHATPFLPGNHLIYTSSDPTMIQVLNDSGMNLAKFTDVETQALIAASNGRFAQQDGTGQFTDGDLAKTLFSHISELVVPAPAGDPLSALSDLVGEVKGEPS